MIYQALDAFVETSDAVHATLSSYGTPLSSWIYKPAEMMASHMDISVVISTLILCM